MHLTLRYVFEIYSEDDMISVVSKFKVIIEVLPLLPVDFDYCSLVKSVPLMREVSVDSNNCPEGSSRIDKEAACQAAVKAQNLAYYCEWKSAGATCTETRQRWR